MPTERADAVICGAGIAGLSVAWQLAVRLRLGRVVVVDERPPLSLTSDKSTECYRNWWPDAAMVALTNRSVELLDSWDAATDGRCALNRNGYLYLTATEAGARELAAAAPRVSALGAGELRTHRGAAHDPDYAEPRWDRPQATADGADLFLDPEEIVRRFPWAPVETRAALHARRCGWLSAQQLGMLFLEQARAAGAELLEGRVAAVESPAGRVAAVRVESRGGWRTIATPRFVNAAGPYVADVARLVGVELPVFHELHRKVLFDDHLGAVPRAAPLVIWQDAVTVDWSAEERAGLLEEPATAALAGELPAGVHFRPEGGAASRAAILLWNYDTAPAERRYPLPDDPLHVQVVVRGVARLLPAFRPYAEGGRRPYVDGGYYTKTRENRPLVGPLGPAGSYLVGALSGFGIMAAPAAGELVAAYVAGERPPAWAAAFRLERYDDPAYLAGLAGAEAGQL